MAEIQYTSLLRSTAADNKLAKTDQIFDDTRSKFQKDINAELLSLASKTEAYVLPGDLGTLGTSSNASAINGVLGTYSAFKAAYDAKKLIVGRWGEYLFAPSVYVDGGTVLLRALSGVGTYRAVSLTFSGSAWTAVKSVSKDSPLVNVVNGLTNSSTASALSAAMGKKLQDEKLAKTDVVNNLTTTDTSKALSAAQGKALNDRINGLGSVYRIKGTKANISEVLALTDAKVGDAWNVTAEFTLGGKKYPAGTNVVCVTNTSSSDHNDDNWDALGGTVDLSAYATTSILNSHTGNKSNPHGVTKSQVGLGNVTNDAQVKKTEVMAEYIAAKIASTTNVPSTKAFAQAAEYAEMFPVSFDATETGTKTIQTASSTVSGGQIVWLSDMKKFAYKLNGTYYNNWAIAGSPNPGLVAASLVKQDDNTPVPGKVYIHDSGAYFAAGTELVKFASVTEVSNSLSDTGTAKALSAAQGKALNDKLTTTTNTANTAKTNAATALSALTIK